MLNESENVNELHWLMEMLHSIDVGLVVLDNQYRIQIWNGFMENHSGLLPREVKDKSLFDLFSEIPKDWFIRKASAVFLLKNKAFTIWEQRPYLFQFQNYRPITGSAEFMYQNSTFIPLMSSTGEVTHLCLLIYDVTDSAVNKLELQHANAELALIGQTDGLTQLFNRAHWEHCLQREYQRWSRTKNQNCLVMLDIDHFKLINDNYGHSVGDDVIRHLSSLIRKQARETDVSGRYGGEEFAILLVDTVAASALVFAERLRKMIENSLVVHNDIEIQYTVSMGVCEIGDHIENHKHWIECTDQALYQSKTNGRNSVVVYEP